MLRKEKAKLTKDENNHRKSETENIKPQLEKKNEKGRESERIKIEIEESIKYKPKDEPIF